MTAWETGYERAQRFIEGLNAALDAARRTGGPVDAEPTPTPWVCNKTWPGIWQIDEEGAAVCGQVATCWTPGGGIPSSEANARLIVTAVNHHAELVALLREFLEPQHGARLRVRAVATLAKIEAAGRTP